MQTFKQLILVTALIILFPPTTLLFAQQTAAQVENAKKEGEVVWYGTLTGGSIVGRILKSFEDKYPSIKVKYLRLGGAGLIERIRSEARGGKYLWDVVTAEYIQFFELPKYVTLAKYAPPEFAQYSPKHRDPYGTWVSFYGAIATIALEYPAREAGGGAKGLEGSPRSQMERKKDRSAGRSVSMVRGHGCLSGRQGGAGIHEGPRGAGSANTSGLYQHRQSLGGW